MRIRQIKPDYWRDEVIAAMPDSVARFYIGIWQEADDAGWLRWNVPEIAQMGNGDPVIIEYIHGIPPGRFTVLF